MVDFLIEMAIQYGIDWLVEWIEDEVGNLIASITSGDPEMIEALENYISGFSWKDDGSGNTYNEIGERIDEVIERFRYNWQLSHDEDPENDLPVESNGIIDTDLEHMQYQELALQKADAIIQANNFRNTSSIMTIGFFCGLWTLFNVIHNYVKNTLFKKFYKGEK